MIRRNSIYILGRLIVLLLGILVWAAPDVRANDASDSVVILSKTTCCPAVSWPEAENALRAELQSMGIPSETRMDTEYGTMNELYDVYEKDPMRPMAIIQVVRSADGNSVTVSIGIRQASTRHRTYRHFTVSDDVESDQFAIVGVLAIEALRAGLRMPKETERDDTVLIGTPPDTSVNRKIVGAYAHVGLADSAGLDGLRMGFGISVVWQPVTWIDLILAWQLFPVGSDINGQGATSSLRYMPLRGWLAFRAMDYKKLRLGMGLGGGAVMVFSKGRESDGIPVKSVWTTVGYMGAMARLQIRLTARLDFVLGGTVGITIPEVSITHGGERVARMGRPLYDGTIGVLLWF